MYSKPVLGLAEAQAAVNAMLDEASKQPDRPVTIAIVDDAGDLISFARMDGCGALVQRLTTKKAYTMAMFGRGSKDLFEFMKVSGRTLWDYADPNITAAPSGAAILRPSDGAILGAMAVSGIGEKANEELCRIGLDAIHLEQE